MPTFSKREKQDKAYGLAFNAVCEFGRGAPGYLRMAAREAVHILADTKVRHKDEAVSCVRHSLYQGVRKPKNNCRECWKVYNAKHKNNN